MTGAGRAEMPTPEVEIVAIDREIADVTLALASLDCDDPDPDVRHAELTERLERLRHDRERLVETATVRRA
jgi:hypothetical protein